MWARRAAMAAVVLGTWAGAALAGAQLVTASGAGTMSKYAEGREAAMKPAQEAMSRGDYAAGLELSRVVLARYPRDARALMLTGQAAWAAGSLQEAAADLRAAAEQDKKYGWRERLQVLSIDAALGAWEDLEKEDAALHEAIGEGAARAEVLKSGYMVELFMVGPTLVQVTEYPELHGDLHVRYRFSYGPGTNGFERHLDLESDPGGFALQEYGAAYEQRLVESFAKGEPQYRAVRERALAAMKRTLGAAEARSICPYVPLDAQ